MRLKKHWKRVVSELKLNFFCRPFDFLQELKSKVNPSSLGGFKIAYKHIQNMKITVKLVLLFCLAFFSSFLNAQTTPAATEPAPVLSTDKEDKDLAKGLNLDKRQQAEFKKINKDYKAKAKAVKQARKEDLKKMRSERIAAHKAMLTEEQARKYDEIVAKREQQKAAKQAEKKAAKKAEKAERKKTGKGQE